MGSNPIPFHPRLLSRGAWASHCLEKPDGIAAGYLVINRAMHPGADRVKLVRPATDHGDRLEFWIELPSEGIEHHDIFLTYAKDSPADSV